jgi:hypothetical protein
VAAYGAGIATLEEARVEIGLPPDMPASAASSASPYGGPGSSGEVSAPNPEDPNADLPEGEPGGPQ